MDLWGQTEHVAVPRYSSLPAPLAVPAQAFALLQPAVFTKISYKRLANGHV